MGTGWRRAFCTTIPRERETEKLRHNNHPNHQNATQNQHQSSTKFGMFSSISNPSTPRLQTTSNPTTPTLRCRTTNVPDGQPITINAAAAAPNPNLECNTSKTSRPKFSSNPSSPRSPFTLLKNTLRFSRNGCGVCLQSVKTGQGMAIYTAECSHAFHFPCIAAHVRTHGKLICPVCNVTWKDVPLLSFHKNHPSESQEIIDKRTITTTTTATAASAASAPATPTGSNRIHFVDKLIQIQSVKSKSSAKSYNDDEPLLSPTSGSRFNPIPEFEESEDFEEFQGFFATPKKKKLHSKSVEVKLLPEAAVVSVARSYETYAVALRVKAPPLSAEVLPPANRAPVDLVTVLDVSGSMSGAKLQMLKRAMRLVISSLSSADRLSIVSFSATSQRLMALKRMTAQGQTSARRIVDQLVCSQGTCVSEALRKAAKVLEDRREKNPVASIMLLSDGHDDSVHGSNNSNQPQSSSHVSSASTRFAHIEIPVHSSGFGFRANEPAEDVFAKCVGDLLSVVVQDLRIQLGFASGSAPADIVAVYSCTSRPSLMSCDSVRLGNLYAEEERELLIELKLPTAAIAIGSHHVMSVRCSYKDPMTQVVMYGRERALLVPRPHSVLSSDPRIERLRNLFMYTRAVAESRRLVDHGDFTSAHHLLSSARALVLQSTGLASAEEYTRGLEAELAQVHWRRQYQMQHQQQVVQVGGGFVDENGEPLTPTSAWRSADRLAKVAIMKKKYLNRSVSDLHGFENARF